jgi:cobalamin-dependent methionine synthase I
MIVIGERLNSSRDDVLDALKRKDGEYIVGEAKAQERAGADYLDINAAALLAGELETLKWAIPLIQGRVSIPLAIDTPSGQAMSEGLSLHKGRAILNSLSGETRRIKEFIPIIKEHKPRVIVLCLDDEGIPKESDKELSIALRMVELLEREGIKPEDIFLDPLVRPIGVEDEAGQLFFESLEKIKAHLPQVKTVAGISNVSFGLPERHLLNRTFLTLATERGLDAAILDPLEKGTLAAVASAEALLGRDPSLKRYLAFIRKQKDQV